MGNKRFKKGDRVKCSWFLYKLEYNKHKEMVGTFNRYNKYDNDIAYINFGQPAQEISCFTEGVELLVTKNQQLLFDFMY